MKALLEEGLLLLAADIDSIGWPGFMSVSRTHPVYDARAPLASYRFLIGMTGV